MLFVCSCWWSPLSWGSSFVYGVLLLCSLSWFEYLTLMSCIGIWRSSCWLCIMDWRYSFGFVHYVLKIFLSIVHWVLEILSWLLHWDLEVVYHEWKIPLWSCALCVEDLLLILCIGSWRSSLGLCIGICESMLILRFVICSHGFLYYSCFLEYFLRVWSCS